jgi:dUTP pyrophosphatase
MKVKIKKLHPDAVVPKYAKEGDAGLDLVAVNGIKYANGYIEYQTGLSFEIPEGHVGLIFPRSSISNHSLSLTNSVGVIDSGYRGEVKFRFRDLKNGTIYKVGDKIGQLIIIPYPQIELEEVEELEESERGTGGFGSSGS